MDAALHGDALNISKGGMFIAMQRPLAVGTEIDVEVVLEDGGLVLHAVVEVVRRVAEGRKPGVGVRFVDVSYEATGLIERMISDERMLGDYKLETLIGSGGMADVYRAKALSGTQIGRTVAIKRIRPELATNATVAGLFEREAAITRALDHPNIVKLYERQQVGDEWFIVLEHVDGCNLAQLIAACKARGIFLPIDFSCYVVHTVAEALHIVHNASDDDGKPLGIVHRDVAPPNVFISELGAIKLGDFGVAAVTGRAGDASTRLIAGKPGYMAPEQWLAGAVSPATDVFGLGAILYEMLTNRTAFRGQSEAALRKACLKGNIVPPREVRPEIPGFLEALVMRALSPRKPGAPGGLRAAVHGFRNRDAPERFADAATFARELRRAFDDAVVNQLAIAAVVRAMFGT
jgi:uncharacterized protein (TIGR02266 family)